MKKKFSTGLLGLALALSLTSCGGDRKAAQISNEILAHIDEVKSYRVEMTLATNGKSDLYRFDMEADKGNLHFHQEQADNKVLDLIRLDNKDYASSDGGQRYMPIDRSALGLIQYRALCGILVPLKYQSNQDDNTLRFSGFDKQIFESLKSAFGLSFKGFSDSDFDLDITVTPAADGRYLETLKAEIKAEQGQRKTEVTILAEISEINKIEPISLPEGTPTHSQTSTEASESQTVAEDKAAAENETAAEEKSETEQTGETTGATAEATKQAA